MSDDVCLSSMFTALWNISIQLWLVQITIMKCASFSERKALNCAGLFYVRVCACVWDILETKGIIIESLCVSRPFLIFFSSCWELLSVQPLCWMTPQSVVELRRHTGPFDWLSLTVLENVLMEAAGGAEGTLCWRGPYTKHAKLQSLDTLTH